MREQKNKKESSFKILYNIRLSTYKLLEEREREGIRKGNG